MGFHPKIPVEELVSRGQSRPCNALHISERKKEAHSARPTTGDWRGFPGGSDGEESACNAGDPGLIPGWGRSLGEGNSNLLDLKSEL